MTELKTLFNGVFLVNGKIATENLVLGVSVYGEQRVEVGKREFRVWDPFRSKPAAAIMQGLKNFPIIRGSSVLYLGIANGTTASHLSDIVGLDGIIFGIDVATKPFEKLLELCKQRENIVPILADANNPDSYKEYLGERVDVLYQDVAQPNQTEILVKNAEKFLKKGGFALVALKSRSIDVTKDPRQVFKDEIRELEKKFRLVEFVLLHPFEKDHCFVVLKF